MKAPSYLWASPKTLAIIACLLWSTAFVGVKIGLRHSTPLSLAGMRFMLSGVLLLPFVVRRKNAWHEIRTHWISILWVSLFQTIILYALFNMGMELVPAAVAAIIIGSSPLSSALVAHFFMKGDRMTLMKTVAIVIGVIGVTIISLMRSNGVGINASRQSLVGIVLLLGATFSSAFGNVVYARMPEKPDGLTLTSVQIFFGGSVLFLASLVVEGPPTSNVLNPTFLGVLLWLAALSAIGFSIWFRLLARPGVKVSDLNVWKFLIPVAGAGLSWTLLSNESPSVGAVVGMACVGCSVVVYGLAARRERAKLQAEAVTIKERG